MNRGAHAADPLREDPGVARIAPAQDKLDAAEHGRGRPRVLDRAAVDFGLDAQVAFDPGDRIDDDVGHHSASALSVRSPVRFARRDGARSRRPRGRPTAAATRPVRPRPIRSTPAAHVEAGNVRQAAGRTASSCPRNSARHSRCKDGRSRSASWCPRSTSRPGSSAKSPAPCSPSCTGSSRGDAPRRPRPRRTGRRRSARAARSCRGSTCRRRRAAAGTGRAAATASTSGSRRSAP